MKNTTITTVNTKGQLVIPKKMRQVLGITPDVPLQVSLRGQGINIFPIDEVITKVDYENSYLKILEKTKGTWAEEDWDTLRKKRRTIELRASKRRKKAW